MDSPLPETAPAVAHQHPGSEAGAVTPNAAYLRTYRAGKRAKGKCTWCGRPSDGKALCPACREKERARNQSKPVSEIVTLSRHEITEKIKEAREKEKWHRTRSYFDDAEYFAGWAHGLEDLLKSPPRRGRKPKPQNQGLDGSHPST